VDKHVIYTSSLPESDLHKFSTSRQGRGTSAYVRLCHLVKGVAPSSERIVQDCNKVLLAMKRIWDAKGVAADCLGNRTGKRFLENKTE
jgi:hypothetical protein